MYCHSWHCRNCQVSLFKSSWELNRHERTCEEGIQRIHKGGVYRPPPSILQRLDDEGIVVDEALRYYPYRATFDFECFFTDHVQWVARHIPLSVSVASNVPGYEPALCFVTDGDADKLVESMMTRLNTIIDAAFATLVPSYADVLGDLVKCSRKWCRASLRSGDDGDDDMNERVRERRRSDDDADDDINARDDMIERAREWRETARDGDDTSAILVGKLLAWMQQLPVIGFNSGRYYLNAIKR